jgi:FkbM family methyltransferase
MLQSIKQTKIGTWLKNSSIPAIIHETKGVGDWRYPFMLVAWKLASLLVPRRQVSINGIRFTLQCNNYITHFRWFLFKKKEPEVRKFIDEYLKNGDVFFDIGANIGVFTVYACKRHPGIKAYCFEPEYSNLTALKENIYHNNLQNRVKIWGIGVSDFFGLSELHIQDMRQGAACHTESKESIDMTDEGYKVIWSEGITCASIDYLCEHIGVVPNIMKIDTDGNEEKILRGGFKTLANDQLRALVIEIPDEEDKRRYCQNVLENSGFKVIWKDEEKTRNQIWAKVS